MHHPSADRKRLVADRHRHYYETPTADLFGDGVGFSASPSKPATVHALYTFKMMQQLGVYRFQ